jgi:hypothetical protein
VKTETMGRSHDSYCEICRVWWSELVFACCPGCAAPDVPGRAADQPDSIAVIDLEAVAPGLVAAAPLTAEQAIEAGLRLLEAATDALAETDPSGGPVNRMTDAQRRRAHQIACGLQDMTFWVRKDPRWPTVYYAAEIETGVGAWGATEQEALANYFAGLHEAPHSPLDVSEQP